jgi:hypothetical protein
VIFTAIIIARTLPAFGSNANIRQAMHVLYLWLIVAEVPFLIGSVLLWAGMVVHAIDIAEIGWTKRLAWITLLFIGVIWGADLYYLLVYKRQGVAKNVQEVST